MGYSGIAVGDFTGIFFTCLAVSARIVADAARLGLDVIEKKRHIYSH